MRESVIEREVGSGFDDLEDEELARVAYGGVREARNLLFARCGELIRKSTLPAKRLLQSRTWSYRGGVPTIDVEDIDQQAFLVFCDVVAEWVPEQGAFERHLARRMSSRLLHFVRDSLKEESRRGHLRWTRDDGEPEGEIGLPPVGMREADALIAWQSHTERLPRPLRETVRLRFHDDLSYAQIATINGCARRTVGRELHAAISLMREAICEEWEH